MRNTLLIILLFAVNTIIYSQNQLSGTITDANSGEPVFSASVYFPQLEKGTMSDEDGKFTLKNVPEGTYKLIVSSIGFSTLNLDVKIPSETISIELNPSAIEMEEVIVSTPFHQLQSENVMKVERKSISELNKKGAVNLSDGITQIAGVESLTTGVGIGKPVIRGLSSNRVLVYTQGIRLENQQYGDEHGLGISSKGIGSVEVIKGPASLLYGSDAIGGVLYLNPERYAAAGETNAALESDYFSNTLGYQASLMAKTSGEKLKFLARGSYAAHSDYKDGDEIRVTNTRFNEKDLKAGIGFQDKNYKADLRYNFNRSEIGIPEEVGIQSKDKEPLLPYQEIDNHVLSLDNRFYFPNSSIDFKLGYQFNDRKEFEEHHGHEEHEEHEEEAAHEEEGYLEEADASAEPALEMHLETINYNLKYNLPKLGNFETIAGIQGMYQTNTNFGEEILIPDAETLDFGFFATTHYHLENWDFQGGLRFDKRNLETQAFQTEEAEVIEGIDRNFNSINAAFGAKYHFDQKFIARLNLASGFRAPNLSELTSNGNHNGANRYEIGNPDLENEQNFQIDLALEWRNEHFEAFVNAFTNNVSDYIYINPTGETIEEEPVFQYEQANANLYGGEVGIHIHPHPLDWLHLESSFETVTGKLNSGGYLPLIPANSLTNTLRIEFEGGNTTFKEKYTFVRLKNVLDQDNPGRFETETNGYSLLGAGVGTVLQFDKVQLDLNLSGTNLLNKTYISHLSRLKQDGIYNIGRNVIFSAYISI